MVNNAPDDLHIFLVRSGTTVRIGTVTALSTHVFVLSEALLGNGTEVELLASPRSSSYGKRSAVFTVSAGQRIAWTVDDKQPSEVVIVR